MLHLQYFELVSRLFQENSDFNCSKRISSKKPRTRQKPLVNFQPVKIKGLRNYLNKPFLRVAQRKTSQGWITKRLNPNWLSLYFDHNLNFDKNIINCEFSSKSVNHS